VVKYLQGYPVALQQQVRQLIADDRLGDYLAQRYPGRHAVQSDKALYAFVSERRQRFLRNAPGIDKVLYEEKEQVAKDSLKRKRLSDLTLSRSTTTSIVCFCFAFKPVT
jgi:predicted metal-dependent hydrolase